MKNEDIIITGIQSWHIEIGSNCKNIATEFSAKNRVLYINPPMDRITQVKSKLNGEVQNERPFLQKIAPNLWVLNTRTVIESINKLPFTWLFNSFNRRNNKRYAKEIKKAIEMLNFTNYLHFCDSDMFRSFFLKQYLQPELFIYYSRDNLQAVDYWKKHGTRLEPQLMKKADLVLANSAYLANKAKEHNPSSFFVGQGCELEAFSKEIKQVPEELRGLEGPIIGYTGVLSSLRLDIALLEEMANKRSDWNFVLVGPEDEEFKTSKLHSYSNVHFIGKKPIELLPAYLNAFTVSINPQVKNEITIGNYPRKIDEYLAIGKPVVATQTEAMQYFSEYVSLSSNSLDWINAIDIAMKTDSVRKQKARKEFALSHSWENNVNEIYKRVYECM